MRILLSTYGSRGDVEPMVALAVALQALGAQVRVCAPSDGEFAELLARADVPFVPFARSWRSWAESRSSSEERVPSVDDFVTGYIAATYDTLAAAAEGCDLFVASGMLHFIAQSVAENVGVPHRFVIFCPSLLGAQGWHALVNAPLNAHRASIGLPPVNDARTFLFTDHPWLAADPILSPEQESGDVPVVRTGAWLLPDNRPLPAALAAFLDAGTPPVYVGFGSMRLPEESARIAIEAVRAQGSRVLLARGWADLGPIDARDDCFAVGEINQQALFGRVAAVVHHGGAGTTTTAAKAGAPQVIVPQAADQPRWASRVIELGIGAAQDGPVLTFEALSAALEAALSSQTRARATAVAGKMRTDGATVAAKLLLETISRKAARAGVNHSDHRATSSPAIDRRLSCEDIPSDWDMWSPALADHRGQR
ncbi:glycosyltransferase [Aquamicrobium sp. LC103]|uniref:glycosyltransferase n=1 Tax=Aquamicrobium sp. LC103 TaxID=1120658 RepID=UPI0009E5532B|nr:glycosyltransferase [Aquamicrobium sp. LC103]TKT78173.1 glycosyltransferase family 1 protein [Aquamicrobium sp. LC103]